MTSQSNPLDTTTFHCYYIKLTLRLPCCFVFVLYVNCWVVLQYFHISWTCTYSWQTTILAYTFLWYIFSWDAKSSGPSLKESALEHPNHPKFYNWNKCQTIRTVIHMKQAAIHHQKSAFFERRWVSSFLSVSFMVVLPSSQLNEGSVTPLAHECIKLLGTCKWHNYRPPALLVVSL